jgi:hypothetical protein
LFVACDDTLRRGSTKKRSCSKHRGLVGLCACLTGSLQEVLTELFWEHARPGRISCYWPARSYRNWPRVTPGSSHVQLFPGRVAHVTSHTLVHKIAEAALIKCFMSPCHRLSLGWVAGDLVTQLLYASGAFDMSTGEVSSHMGMPTSGAGDAGFVPDADTVPSGDSFADPEGAIGQEASSPKPGRDPGHPLPEDDVACHPPAFATVASAVGERPSSNQPTIAHHPTVEHLARVMYVVTRCYAICWC